MNSNKTAFIFAAGLGTRLRPLTDNCPKALVEIGGRPLLWHTIMRLKAAGYTRFVVNIHHLARMIQDYVALEDDFEGLDIRFSDESNLLLDTGGGLLAASTLLEGCGEFLVHNVDILTSGIDYSVLTLPMGALAALVVSQRESTRVLYHNTEGKLCGWKNLKNGATKGLVFDANNLEASAFSGIHILSEAIFPVLKEYANKTLGLQGSQPFPIMDFYLERCPKGDILCLPHPNAKVLDVGKPEALPKALNFI